MKRTSWVILALTLTFNVAVAVVRLRKPSNDPKDDGSKTEDEAEDQHIQTEKEFASNYTQDKNGGGSSDPDVKVKDIQSEKEFHENYTKDDRPDPNAGSPPGGGKPGTGGEEMVPRTMHVGPKQDHHDDHHWSYEEADS